MENIPFIKLIEQYGNYYFFDVNKNDIVKISEGLYKYLEELLHNPDAECESVAGEFNNLKKAGYLSGNRIKVIRHPDLPLLENYLERKINMVTIQLTQSCNLRCSYCIYSDFKNDGQRTHSGKRMSLETAKKAVDFLAVHSVDSESVSIGFYGGEPLLEFELIKNVAEYAEGILGDKYLNFSITTNATMLSDYIIDYLKEHNFQLMISLDGPKEIHDVNRRFASDGRGSFDTVLENIRMVKERYPDYFDKISINMVIDPQNDFDTINSLFTASDIFGYNNVQSSIIDDIYSMEKVTYSDEYISKRDYNIFLAHLARKGRIAESKVPPVALEEVRHLENELLKMKKTEALSEIGTHGGPCIPGQLRLFVDVDGNFYPCERVSESSSVMQIGNLQDGFDYKKARKILNIGELTSEECKKCWAVRHCTLCAKYADDGNSFSKEKKLSNCSGVREQTLYILKNMILLKELENKRRER